MTTIYVKNGTPLETQSKCASCLHAHIVSGYRESEELAYCTVAYGPPLVVPSKIYHCTSYTDRSRPTWKQMEDLAIDILPLSSAKSAGFRKHRDRDSPAEDEEESELEAVDR
jgi:hypothetical protein